jgi:hypothetical protein
MFHVLTQLDHLNDNAKKEYSLNESLVEITALTFISIAIHLPSRSHL